MSAIGILFGCLILGLLALAVGLAVGGWLLGVFVALLAIAFVLFLLFFWIWMLVSAIRNKGIGDGEKVGWVLAIVFFHLIGSLLYLLIAFPRRNNTRPLGVSALRA